MIGGKRYRWEHDSYDIVFRAQDDGNTCFISDLLKQWHADRSSSSDTVVARFLKLNSKAFDFLGIFPYESENHIKLIFKTSNYVGCVPLISPVTGKTYANLIVNGRFDEEVSEILPLLPDSLDIDYNNDLILPHQTKVKPPIYFECIKYMEKYLVSRRLHWRKFINENKIQSTPSSSTNWGKYAEMSYSPSNILKYPNKVNSLTTNHNEWQQINYVLKLCIEELNSKNTPSKTRISYSNKLSNLQIILQSQSMLETTELRIHAADPNDIKQIKNIGNRILESTGADYHAWRIDFNKLFEQYVQYVLEKASSSIHASSFNNSKYSINGQQTAWTLSYLEPDIILRKDDKLIIVDAKYKTHMLNRLSGNVDSLHESFRHDLHQVLAYSSFDPTSHKIAMLVFPNNRFNYIKQVISSPLSSITSHVYLIGIPFGTLPDDEDDSRKTMTDNVHIAIEGIEKILNTELS